MELVAGGGAGRTQPVKGGNSSRGMQLICQKHGQRMPWMKKRFQDKLGDFMKKKFTGVNKYAEIKHV